MDHNSPQTPLETRFYGASGPHVVVLHGGPGAPGYMAPVARELSHRFRVIEPFQRGGDYERLTVARHVADLHELIETFCGDQRPALVGHSWGAMLALAYAAAHPGCAACLALIGCGTVDSAARDRLRVIRNQRMGEDLIRRVERLDERTSDPDERLRKMGRMMQRADSYDLIPGTDETIRYDARAFEQSWADMLRLQETGIFPAAFEEIHSPVIMLHGTFDPHPGKMIRASLQPYLPQLEYREWDRCGHYPWLEKAVQKEFYAALLEWLSRNTTQATRPLG
jgi:pimeloyl-ACP methyl ester carboxylesterase